MTPRGTTVLSVHEDNRQHLPGHDEVRSTVTVEVDHDLVQSAGMTGYSAAKDAAENAVEGMALQRNVTAISPVGETVDRYSVEIIALIEY